MTDIPEDVMKRARDIVFDFDCDWTADGRSRGDREEQDAVEAVARALMEERAAERERCATIVDAMQADEIREYSIDLQHAARAIRGQP